MIGLLGQIALTQDTTKAIQFFQIGLELYPKSYRGYDRLGNIWMARGDQQKARGYFEESLARNPNNKNAKDMISKMKP